jgi:hypothetical protein
MKYWRVEIERPDGRIKTYYAETKQEGVNGALFLGEVHITGSGKVADQITIPYLGVDEMRYTEVDRIGA